MGWKGRGRLVGERGMRRREMGRARDRSEDKCTERKGGGEMGGRERQREGLRKRGRKGEWG